MKYTAYRKSDPYTLYEIEGTTKNLAAFIATRSPFENDFYIFRDGRLFLTLVGFFIDRAVDKDFLAYELLPVLVPMQQREVPIPTVNITKKYVNKQREDVLL